MNGQLSRYSWILAIPLLAALGCNPASTSIESGDTGSGDESGTTDGGMKLDVGSEDQVIRLGKLVNPKDELVIDDAIIVISGDRIVYVGTDEAEIPSGATIIDWSGYTGLPGFVDAHTHLAYVADIAEGFTFWQRQSWLISYDFALYEALVREAAQAMLATGVTTALDKGAGNVSYVVEQLQQQIADGQTPGPRVFHAGPGISIAYVDSVAEAEMTAQYNWQLGADFLKIWSEDCSGNYLDCTPSFDADVFQAAIDKAHSLGMSVAVHAYHAPAARAAILAGADMLEHPEGLEAADFEDMIADDIIYVPTIDHNSYYIDNAQYYGYTPQDVAGLEAFIQLNLATLAEAHQAGVKIAMGSDALFNGFGRNTQELGWFVQAGMTPMEALRAATIHGAEGIGVDDQIGSIEPGYFADIIAVEGDPLADIDVAINGVKAVMVAGKLMEISAPTSNDALASGVRPAKPLTHAGARVSVDARRSDTDLLLRARVEFEGAELGLNHERAVTAAESGHVFLGLRELGTLPDDRWLVDVVLTRTGGDDSGSRVTTEHSVIIVDPGDASAALLWSGVDSSLSRWGVCTTERTHEFVVIDGALVIAETVGTELDGHAADELGVTADACPREPETTAEVARIGLVPAVA